ncbi:MAG: Regulatory protein AtoC [Candidatus Marinimicrobia bacterium]|nr:Regulatory protein AtoC [Candidatus Neomarinimicrobiota bacterium]
MNVLVVDDEKNIRISLGSILEDEGYDVITAETGEEGLRALDNNPIDLILLDVKLPGMDGVEALEKILEKNEDMDVIMISGHSDISIAVKAIKMGAYDFMEKPLSLPKIVVAARNIAEKQRLYQRFRQEKEEMDDQYRIVGESPQIEEVREVIKKVAGQESKVLIRGESGTGKELVAYAIHAKSSRKQGPFGKFNCAAIPNELVESELFGHEKGAFTGAEKRKLGKLELADGGTLFLDEIGDMNLDAQAKVLRVIQEGKFERVGGNETIDIDVRILAATNKNLEQMIENGTFREDLFYRLNVIPIEIPPLRERTGDVDILLDYYLGYFANDLKTDPKEFSDEALKLLRTYEWPGNIRELRNLVERMYILTSGDVIEADDVRSSLTSDEAPGGGSYPFLETKDFSEVRKEFEVYYLKRQLEKFDWNISEVADHLGMAQPNLSRKIKQLNIEKQ